MLALYHSGGAICAQKVRLALAEKQLDWESRLVGLGSQDGGLRSPDYLKLNPNGVVPTLVHDEKVLIESRIISEYIDDAFEGPKLLPADPFQRHQARLWSKQIDDSLHFHIFVLSFVVGMREMYMKMPEQDRASRLPGLRDALKRMCTLDLMKNHFESPYVDAALERFTRLVREMNQALADHTWLAGDAYSLADADYTAYLNRLSELGLDHLWADAPHAASWYDRVRARPSYGAAIANWTTPEERALKADQAGRNAPRLKEMGMALQP